MTRRAWYIGAIVVVAIGVFAIAAFVLPNMHFGPYKKLVLLTHWQENPEFNKWYAEKGAEFARKSGYQVDILNIPYPGYDAKYLELLSVKTGAPDIFMGLTHQWCGQHDFCDRMPPELATVYDANLPGYLKSVGKWKDVRYGVPIENGNFQQMFINVDMFKAAGLNPDEPPKTMNEWLAAVQKLTIAGTSDREPAQAGFVIRNKAHPIGMTTDFLSFAHAFGARMLSPELDKATGFANSAEMVAALTFYGDLALKHKVTNLALDNPLQAFGQKRAAVLFMTSWYADWLKKNAPDVNYRIHALPCEKACPGASVLFPWTDLVNKSSDNKEMAWQFITYISNARDDLEHHKRQGLLPLWAENIESHYVKARPDYRSVKEMLSRPPAPSYFHPRLYAMASAFGEAVIGAVEGSKTPQALLDEAAAKMDRILSE